MTFWERFQELCTQRKTTPNAVAASLGFSNSTCTKWKKGAVPSSASAGKIADHFNKSVDYVLGKEETTDSRTEASTYFHQDEILHIQKYRILDESGKNAVDTTLEKEYKRCTENPNIERTPMKWAVPPVEESKAIASADIDTNALNEPPETEEPFKKVPKDEV